MIRSERVPSVKAVLQVVDRFGILGKTSACRFLITEMGSMPRINRIQLDV